MISRLLSGHDFYTENYKRGIILQKDTISILTIYKITKWHKTEKNVEGVTVHTQSLVKLLYVPSFVKLSQTVSKL